MYRKYLFLFLLIPLSAISGMDFPVNSVVTKDFSGNENPFTQDNTKLTSGSCLYKPFYQRHLFYHQYHKDKGCNKSMSVSRQTYGKFSNYKRPK